MIAEKIFVGIDVARARLDVYVDPEGTSLSVENDPRAIQALIRRLRRFPCVVVGLEASGGYEKSVAKRLHAAGLVVHVLDPAQVRAFARSMKRRAKTDRIDAMMIARYLKAALDVLVPFVPDPDAERLGELVAYRRRLVAEGATLKGQIALAEEATVRRMMTTRLRGIAQAVLVLEKTIRQLIAQQQRFARTAALLRTVAGVGPVLVATLLAELPELGTISAKRIASLVGVAPHARQSGATDRGGRCTGGRGQIRDILYMGALSAVTAKDPHLEPFYKRLRQAGKPFKLAITAVMRKLITRLNAIVRDDLAIRQTTVA